jgi:hypothetical protein
MPRDPELKRVHSLGRPVLVRRWEMVRADTIPLKRRRHGWRRQRRSVGNARKLGLEIKWLRNNVQIFLLPDAEIKLAVAVVRTGARKWERVRGSVAEGSVALRLGCPRQPLPYHHFPEHPRTSCSSLFLSPFPIFLYGVPVSRTLFSSPVLAFTFPTGTSVNAQMQLPRAPASFVPSTTPILFTHASISSSPLGSYAPSKQLLSLLPTLLTRPLTLTCISADSNLTANIVHELYSAPIHFPRAFPSSSPMISVSLQTRDMLPLLSRHPLPIVQVSWKRISTVETISVASSWLSTPSRLS